MEAQNAAHPTQSPPTWFLVGEIDAHGESTRVPIDSSPFRVGRNTGLSMSLSCLSVSKLHAELVRVNQALWLRDLGSLNGTYLNGSRVRTEMQLAPGDMLQFGNVMCQLEVDDEAAVETRTLESDAPDQALRLLNFNELMEQRAIGACFQPIIELATGKTMGYEVFGRSPFYGLKTPGAMFEIAAKLHLEAELSRILRSQGVQAAASIPGPIHLFLNTHPIEVTKPGLIESLAEAREYCPSIPLTLEIHECTVVRADLLHDLRRDLASLNIGLAYDDFGAGQSRLLELTEFPPDYLKFDISLVKNLHSARGSRYRMVSDMVRNAQDAGIVCIAEGIERAEESRACREAGFCYGQGFFFGRPETAEQITARLKRST